MRARPDLYHIPIQQVEYLAGVQRKKSGTMMYLKSCARCEGDRSLDHDFDGFYLLCLQCGSVQYPSIQSKPTFKHSIFTQARSDQVVGPSAETIVERLRKSVAMRTA